MQYSIAVSVVALNGKQKANRSSELREQVIFPRLLIKRRGSAPFFGEAARQSCEAWMGRELNWRHFFY